MAVGEIFSRLIDEFGRSIFSNPRLPIGGAVIHRHDKRGFGNQGRKENPENRLGRFTVVAILDVRSCSQSGRLGGRRTREEPVGAPLPLTHRTRCYRRCSRLRLAASRRPGRRRRFEHVPTSRGGSRPTDPSVPTPRLGARSTPSAKGSRTWRPSGRRTSRWCPRGVSKSRTGRFWRTPTRSRTPCAPPSRRCATTDARARRGTR